MMKLQLRKMADGHLAVTDEEGEFLPGQIAVQVIAEKVIVEFGLWDGGIELSSEPALIRARDDSWTKTGRDREHQ